MSARVFWPASSRLRTLTEAVSRSVAPTTVGPSVSESKDERGRARKRNGPRVKFHWAISELRIFLGRVSPETSTSA